MIGNQILKDVLGSLVVVVSPFVVVLGQLAAFSGQSRLLTGIDGPGGGRIKFDIAVFFVGVLVLVIGSPSSIVPGSLLLVVVVATPMAAHGGCFLNFHNYSECVSNSCANQSSTSVKEYLSGFKL